MTPLTSLILLLLSCLCQSKTSASPWAADATTVAFFPRGGAIGRSRRGRSKAKSADVSVDVEPPTDSHEENDDGGDGDVQFDAVEVSKKLHREEVAEIKESQKLLQKQQRRRKLDETWLDKGITSVIEFFENLFSWKVIDV